MGTTPATPRRPRDPERRLRIVEAALDVIAETGIEGLTHRAVAERADVPLGALTYYFVDKDDLVASAVELASQRNIASNMQLLLALIEKFDLPRTLAELVDELTRNRRPQLLLDYHLYLAAIRRPALRGKGAEWADALNQFIYDRADSVAGPALAYAIDGALIRAALLDIVIPRSEIEPVFRRIVEQEPPPTG
jgi:DNA-binding transcriptional regulator YbjK